jgi:hypothetical protein
MKICQILERANPIQVSNLSAEYADKVLYGLQDQITNSRSISELLSLLNKAGQQFQIQFVYQKDSNSNLGLAGGGVGSDGNIRLYVGDRFLSTVKDPETQESAFADLRSKVAHELTHREQGTRSNQQIFKGPKSFSKLGNDRAQYLADPQEIGANAQQIVAQLEDSGVSDRGIVAALRDVNNQTLAKSTKWQEYLSQFGKNDPYKVLARLRKNIVDIISSRI